jgi:SAM-dependent methyltransferase
MKDVKGTYGSFHATQNPEHVYPSEWVIRTFLGKYPKLEMDKTRYPGAKILDIGFGDGRNWPLLRNVGFDVHGVEITEDIVRLGEERARKLDMAATLRVGTNSSIPFEDGTFDYILASHSCYYVDEGTRFPDNMREYSRVLKPGGILVASLPEASNAIFDQCVELDDGHVEIRNDPWGLRNGYIFKWFRDEASVAESFSPWFENFAIGACRNDYFGVQIDMFLLVCTKASAKQDGAA